MKTTVSIELEIPHPTGVIPVEVVGVVTEIRDRCDTDRGVQELVSYEAEIKFAVAPILGLGLNVYSWLNANLDTVKDKLIEEYKNQPERA
jgi:hypothetical protein